MKLILASMLNKSQQKVAPILKGAGINSALCITTAASVYAPAERGWQTEEMNAVRQMGIELDAFDLVDKSYDDVRGKLFNHRCVYVTGGNTYFLLEHMRLSGFDRAIKEWASDEKLYIGCSAGAVVACPRIDYIDEMDDPEKSSLTEFSGLHLYPNLVMVHVDNSHYGAIAKSLMTKWQNKGYEIIPLNDDQAIWCDGINKEGIL